MTKASLRWYERPAGWFAITLLLVLIGSAAYLQLQTPPPGAAKSAATPGPNVRAGPTPTHVPSPTTVSTPVPPSAGASGIDTVWARLQGGAAHADDLAELRRQLLAGDPRQSIAAIRAFLATGRDAATGEAFGIGEKGALAGAPTLRVLLMDLLGQIAARTGGGEAAQVGREILGAKTTADEWAVSLRNVGQHEPAATPYLAGKAREMLAWQPWRSAPSGGFLESFDVPVFAADASFVPVFSELSHSETNPLKRAATVAMDRLSEANPLAVMDYLNAHPTEFADRPFLRADYYGKADLSNGQQRGAVEAYLTRADVTLDEKAKVIASLVSPASFISDALLSAPALRPESPARQNAVPTTLRAWSTDERFTALRPVIVQTLQQIGK
ncbi:MAG TPA: hypothetical protein VGO11_06050 [Chthoniobacteraceae bacterium]|jgi:hypothetical protein|nr:hypothetical protein [Chthoniobacteraceae bacterium]